MTDRTREAVIAEARKGISAVTNCAWERLTPGERSGAEWALEALYDAGLLHAGWRPISEAPKDGTEILTYRGAGLMAVAMWDADTPTGGSWLVTDGMYLLNVTHWRPLPPPPGDRDHD